MKQYVDYDFYAKEYGSKIPVDDFSQYEREAAAYIRGLTLKKSDDFEGDELKYATCAVAEAFFKFDKSCLNGKMVSSENNDGYLVSYVNTGNDAEREKMNVAYSAARKWLLGTGLLNRRAKRVSKC